jgi:spore coat protein U-like protein
VLRPGPEFDLGSSHVRYRNLPFVLLAVVPVIALAPSAWAQAATNNLAVDATVTTECTVTAGAVYFGDYAPITSPNDTASAGTFTVYCTKGTAVHVGMGQGAHYNGVRRMSDGAAHFLTYVLYKEGAHTKVWNDTDSLDRVAIASTAGIGGNRKNVFALLPKNQDQPAGEYIDTVAINVWID